MGWYGRGYSWAPYVPVAKKREKARREMARRLARGKEVRPVQCAGRIIASSFWGKGWCDHIESFSDFENRLPRGRTYVRNGSVCHLGISPGSVDAFVAGSELYKVGIRIAKLPLKQWKEIRKQCAGGIGSLLELLQGRLSDNVMRIVTDRGKGLFPRPGQMKFSCSCPDWASMCKHVAAVLYGVGARLDEQPDLLFGLRGVDVNDLISADAVIEVPGGKAKKRRRIAKGRIEEVFGIELDDGGAPPAPPPKPRRARGRKGRKRVTSHAGERAAPTRRKGARVRLGADDAMAAFRKTARGRGFMSPEEAIVEAAFELGIADTVHEMEGEFRKLLRAAVRKRVLRKDGDGRVGPGTRSLTDYEEAELAEHLRACAKKGVIVDANELEHRCALRLGFTRLRKSHLKRLRAALAMAVKDGRFKKVRGSRVSRLK